MSKFGGVPVEDTGEEYIAPQYSKFGGIPVEDAPPIKRGEVSKAGFSLGRMFGNVPGSLKQEARNLAAPVLDTKNFFTGLKDLVTSAAYHLVPGEQPEEKMVNDVIQSYKETYGSWENALAELEENPMRVVSDLSTVMMAGGGVARLPAKAAGVVSDTSIFTPLAEAGRKVQNVGAAIDPYNMLFKKPVKGAAVKQVQRGIPGTELKYDPVVSMNKMLRPDPQKRLTPAKRRELGQIVLDGGYELTEKGFDKFQKVLREHEKKVQGALDAASPTIRIPLSEKYSGLSDLRRRFTGKSNANAARNMRMIDRLEDQMRAYDRDVLKGRPMTLQEMHKFKRDSNSWANWAKTRNNVTEEFFKALQRGSRRAVEKRVPGYKSANEQFAKPLSVEPAFRTAVGALEQAAPPMLRPAMNIGAGAAMAGPTGAVGGAGLSILEMPRIRGKIAINTNRFNKRSLLDEMLYNNLFLTGGREGIMQTSRAIEEYDQ